MNSTMVMVLGKNHTGKTEFLKSVLVPKLKRCVIIDSQNCFQVRQDYGVSVDNFHDFKNEFDRSYHYGYWQIVCKTPDLDIDEEIIKYVQSRGYCSLVIDEIDLYDTPKHQTAHMKKIVTKSNHSKINLFVTTQRATSVSRLMRSQMHIVITFCQDEPEDVKQLQKMLAIDEKNFYNLNQGQFIVLRGYEAFNKLCTKLNVNELIGGLNGTSSGKNSGTERNLVRTFKKAH